MFPKMNGVGKVYRKNSRRVIAFYYFIRRTRESLFDGFKESSYINNNHNYSYFFLWPFHCTSLKLQAILEMMLDVIFLLLAIFFKRYVVMWVS
jgi:hypothetical protein